MISVRRADSRQPDRNYKQAGWHSLISASGEDRPFDGFDALEALNENMLAPGAVAPQQPRHDAEIVTCVGEGTLAYEDSTGLAGVIQTGEVQRRTAARGISFSERNASRADCAHIFQIWLRPSELTMEPSCEQNRFSIAERRRGFCLLASPDARKGSLRLHLDASVYSAVLYPGKHLVHELSPGRSAWVHVMQGGVTLGEVNLTTGDGAGVKDERAVSLTAGEETEVLLLEFDG